MVQELTYAGYESTIHSDKPVVVEFYSPTCTHCKQTEVGLNELAGELEGKVTFARVDATKEIALAAQLEVLSVPTLLFLRDGEIKDRRTGFTHKLIIAETIKKL